jgi:hypothetical protein
MKGAVDLPCAADAEAVSHQISGGTLFWDRYMLPNDESRLLSMYTCALVWIQEDVDVVMATLGGYGDLNKVSKRNNMNNHGRYKYLE